LIAVLKSIFGELETAGTPRFAAVGIPRSFLMEILKMELAQQVRHSAVKGEGRNHEMSIILGYSILAVLMLMAIVFACGGPGVSPEDLASMTVFP
jgi:hypothetical protein